MNIDDLRWMAGSWTCEIWGGTFEEVWLLPAGRTMQGVGRHLSGGKTGFMEFMSIEPTPDGGLTMWMVLGAPSKGEKKPVPFKATKVDAKESVWENPENDSPNAIHYSRGDDEDMVCRLKSSGKPDEVFRFVRSK
jgi:hypothetical protein